MPASDSWLATYARILDGETLWLALESDAPTVSLRYAGGELTQPTEPEPGGLVSARVPLGPLADLPGHRLEVAVWAGGAPIRWSPAPAPGPVRAAISTRDRRWRWRMAADRDELTLIRLPVEPGVVVTRIDSDALGVHLELADGRILDVHPDADLTAGGLPLVRAHDDLKRPNFAVVLPRLPDGTGLRWSPEGRLLLLPPEVRDVDRRSAGNGASKSEELS